MSKAENKELQSKRQKLLTPQSGDIESKIENIFSVTHGALNSDKDAYVCFDKELWEILPQVEAKNWQERLWGPEDFEIHLSSSYRNSRDPVPYEKSERGAAPGDYLLKRGRILYQIQTPKEKGKVITASLIMRENDKVRLKFFFSLCNGYFYLPSGINLIPHLNIYPEDSRGVHQEYWSPISQAKAFLILLALAVTPFFSRISEGDPVKAKKFTDAIEKLIQMRNQNCQLLLPSREDRPLGITYDTAVLREYRSAWKQTFFASFEEASNSSEKGVAKIIWNYIP